MGSRRACHDNGRKPAFITLGGEPYLVRYNSKLPLVVYVPAGSEVRYRIWAAQNPSHLIGEG